MRDEQDRMAHDTQTEAQDDRDAMRARGHSASKGGERADAPQSPPETPAAQAQRKQERDLDSGEENPG